MGFSLKNKAKLLQYIGAQSKLIESALMYALEAMVADLQNHAKLSAGYKDQTSNLKSSIGGVVLKDGKPISYEGFDGTETGVSTGNEFLNSLIPDYPSGFVVIMVAGMNYATYVEDYHGLNVLKKTELKMKRDLQKLVQKLKNKIK